MTEEVGELKEAIKQLEEKLVESSEALKDLQGNKVKGFSSYPPSDFFLSCRLFFPITLTITNQRDNTLLKFRDKHWLISCFLCGSENGESCCILKQEKLEADIKVKKNSLLIDQQKCMSMRRTLPYNIVATRYF